MDAQSKGGRTPSMLCKKWGVRIGRGDCSDIWPTLGFVLQPVGTRSAPPRSTLALGGQLEGEAVPRRQKAETERMKRRQTGLRAVALAALLLVPPPIATQPQLLPPVPSASKIRAQVQQGRLRFQMQAARWLWSIGYSLGFAGGARRGGGRLGNRLRQQEQAQLVRGAGRRRRGGLDPTLLGLQMTWRPLCKC